MFQLRTKVQLKSGIRLSATIAVFVLGFALISCSDSPYEAKLQIFGTLLVIKLDGVEHGEAEAVVAAINQDLQRLHRDWHAWQPGLLETINAALAAGRAHSIDTDLAELLRAAKTLEARSAGSFNAAVGNLIRAWGFHTSDYPVRQAAPDTELIERLVADRPSLRDVTIEDHQISSRNPAVRIDLGGIAKGAALVRVANHINSLQAHRALIDFGGDLLARSEDRPWRIAIRDPSDPATALALIEVASPLAVFSSGNYARHRNDDSRRGHIIDPRSGQPVEHTLSATVVSADPIVADAAATALVVAGPEHWRGVAAAMGIEQALVVLADGCIDITHQLATMIDWTTPPACLSID